MTSGNQFFRAWKSKGLQVVLPLNFLEFVTIELHSYSITTSDTHNLLYGLIEEIHSFTFRLRQNPQIVENACFLSLLFAKNRTRGRRRSTTLIYGLLTFCLEIVWVKKPMWHQVRENQFHYHYKYWNARAKERNSNPSTRIWNLYCPLQLKWKFFSITD